MFLFEVGQVSPHDTTVVESEMEGKSVFGYEEAQSHKRMILMTMLLLCVLMICFALGLLDTEDELWFDDVFEDDDSIPWTEIEEEMRQQLSSIGTAIMGIFSAFSGIQQSIDRSSSGISLSSFDEMETHGGRDDIDREGGGIRENTHAQTYAFTDTTSINVTNPIASHLSNYGTIP